MPMEIKLNGKQRKLFEKLLSRTTKNLKDTERWMGKLAVQRVDDIQMIKEIEALLTNGLIEKDSILWRELSAK